MKKTVYYEMKMLIICVGLLLLFPSLASAQVSYVSSASAGDDGVSTISVATPAGILVGDLLVGVVATYEANLNISAPAGWVEQFEQANANEVDLALFYKVATSADVTTPSFIFTLDDDKEVIASIFAYRGVDTSAPVVGHQITLGSGTSATAPNVNAGANINNRVIRLVAYGDNEDPLASPPTERLDRQEGGGRGGGVSLTVSDAAKATSGNTGTATFSGAEDRDYVVATFVIRSPQGPNISVNKTTTTPSVTQFDQATYVIEVANVSVGTLAGDVRLADALPLGFNLAAATLTSVTGGATGPSGATSGADITTSNVGTLADPVFDGFTLPSGSSVTLSLVVDIDDSIASGVYDNSVTVTSNASAFDAVSDDGTQGDEDVSVSVACPATDLLNTATVTVSNDIDPTNNSSSVCTVFVPEPILVVSKADSPDPVRRGQNLTYTLTITNLNASVSDANGVELTDVLPQGVTWLSTQNSNGGGTCTASALTACNCSSPGDSGEVVCQMGVLIPGQTETVIITTKVN